VINDNHQLVADSVKFKPSDLKAAQDIQAGLALTQQQVAANQADIQANQQANQQKIAANQQKIAANQTEIAAANKRFEELGEYNIFGDFRRVAVFLDWVAETRMATKSFSGKMHAATRLRGGKALQVRNVLSKWMILVCWACLPTQAQEAQFLPEVDAHLTLNATLRAYLEAKDDRDGGDPTQFAIGPSLQIYLKPLIKLKKVTAFDLDDSKSRFLVLDFGYRYITAPDAPPENRMQEAATMNFPLIAQLHLSDRNRTDLDWKNGVFTWRYRNRLTLERTLPIRSYHLIPYVAAEPFYESQYKKWSTTSLYAGCLFPVGKHVQFNTYYEHDNNTGKHPNQQVNSAGLALYLYFSLEK
jgi:hypothetical protein